MGENERTLCVRCSVLRIVYRANSVQVNCIELVCDVTNQELLSDDDGWMELRHAGNNWLHIILGYIILLHISYPWSVILTNKHNHTDILVFIQHYYMYRLFTSVVIRYVSVYSLCELMHTWWCVTRQLKHVAVLKKGPVHYICTVVFISWYNIFMTVYQSINNTLCDTKGKLLQYFIVVNTTRCNERKQKHILPLKKK
jgi:hypothetical protein